jgi:acyl-CoA dehydrogenase
MPRKIFKEEQQNGGYGYMEEYPICRFARDVRVIPMLASL